MNDTPSFSPRIQSSSALPRSARLETSNLPAASLHRSCSATSLANQVAHPLDVRHASLAPQSEENPGKSWNGITSVRSRKPTNAVDAYEDATRPSLKRYEAALVGLGALSVESNAKARTSLDELSREQATGGEEREVVVHELIKTDTIASVSLQYGITPQALRLSNRLWPSDSIHLRRNLNIPLDQCNLPSSSSIERVSRKEDGNLIVWERETSIERRATNSSYDGDLIGGFGEGTSRSSLDSFREASRPRLDGYQGKGKGPALLIDGNELEELDDAVSDYLPSTNNPYSFSAPPSPPFPTSSTFNSEFFTHSPTNSLGTNDPGPSSSTDSLDSHSRNWNSLAPSYSPTLNPPNSTGSLSRRTLTVERVPSSSMSFFPPPNPSFSNSSSTRSSFESAPTTVDEQALRAMFATGSTSTRSKRQIVNTSSLAKGKGKSTPARQNLSAVNPTWSSFVSPPSAGKSNGKRSSKDAYAQSHELETSKTASWMGNWDPFDFGGAEEAASESVLLQSEGRARATGVSQSSDRRASAAGTIRAKNRPRQVAEEELL